MRRTQRSHASIGTVSVRSRSGGDLGARPVDEFVAQALREIETKGEPEAKIDEVVFD